jgi:hypothetical protein
VPSSESTEPVGNAKRASRYGYFRLTIKSVLNLC